MAVKCIAVGNRLMSDDKIGILVLEEIATELMKKDIEVIISETDTYHAFSQIEEEDFLVILDATYVGKAPGTVTYTPIDEAIIRTHQSCSLHQESLIDLLRITKKPVKGFIIGIEVGEVAFNLNLSDILRVNFANICTEIKNFLTAIDTIPLSKNNNLIKSR